MTPFRFQLLTIISSFIGTHLYKHMQLLVFLIVNIQITFVTLNDYKSFDSQTRYTFPSLNSYLFHTYTTDILICLFFYEYLMSLNVLTTSFVFLWVRGPAHSKNARCHFWCGPTANSVCICKFKARR